MIVLLTKHNSYIGREYATALIVAGVEFVVVAFGCHPQIEEAEERRCGGYWRPPILDEIALSRKIERFSSTSDAKFLKHLSRSNYVFGIQGDIGEIVNRDLLRYFPNGIINFHPGDLPAYRGCDAPEWQILEGRSVICTAHLLDEDIDTGPVIQKKKLTLDSQSYHQLRASLYPAIGEYVAELCAELLKQEKIVPHPQGSGIYRRRMSPENLEKVRHLVEPN